MTENAAAVFGPEKQDYPGGPIYRVGTSTGVCMPDQPSVPSSQEVARRRGELLSEARGDFMSIKEAMDKQSSALAGSVAATCEYQIARISAELKGA